MNQSADNSPPATPEPNDAEPAAAKSSSNRREFLTGMGAIKAIRENAQAQLDAVDAAWNAAGNDVTGVWEQYSKTAMACEFEISFNMHQYPKASPTTMLAFQLVDDLEDQLTIYREHSEVSQLNQLATETPQTVDPGALGIRITKRCRTGGR